MRNLSISAAVLLLLALATGCSERNEPTAATDPLTASHFDLASRPDVAGIVFRGEWGFSVGFMNVEEELLSFHSTSYPPIPSICSPATDFEPIYWQDVLAPSGKYHELWIAPKAFVAVYDWTGTPWPDCDYLNNVTNKLLAEGQVQWMYVDNDFTGGAANGGTGANVWQIKASGQLTNVVTGQSHGYHKMNRWQLLPNGEYRFAGAGPSLNPDPR